MIPVIAPAVVAAAISFWTTIQPADPPCPNGVQIRVAPVPAVLDEEAASMPPGGRIMAWVGIGARDCRVWVSKDFRWLTQPRQCATVAHELGHNWYGLGHVTDRPNIMNLFDPPVPGVCAGLRRWSS